MALLLKRREEQLTNRGADASVTAGESMAPSEAWLKRIEKSSNTFCLSLLLYNKKTSVIGINSVY